jgi:hypothetical protein
MRSPDERSDIRGASPHIAEPVIGRALRDPVAHAGYLL